MEFREKRISNDDQNYYYLMLVSIMLFGYTIRSSVFDGVIGYVNIIAYICMGVILFKYYKHINKDIFIVAFIMILIIGVDIATKSKLDSMIRSLIAFVIPLSFLCIDHNKIIKDKKQFISRFIKIFNVLILTVFIYMLIDSITGCYLTKSLGSVFENFQQYIPKNTGFLKYRSSSYLGHQLYTKHFMLMFYTLNMLYFTVTSKKLLNIGLVHVISILSILMSGSKTALVALFILILLFNIRGSKKYINLSILFIGVVVMYYMGFFDYIIHRFMTTSLTTGRQEGWKIISQELTGVKLIGGQGENLFTILTDKFNMTQITAAFEYPIRIFAYRYGILVAALITYKLYIKSMYKFLNGKCLIIFMCFALMTAETNTFNQLVFNPDSAILIVLWNIVFDFLFDIWKESNDKDEKNIDKIGVKIMIKKLLNRIIFPNTYSSEAYANYLRKKGCKVGKNVHFVNPKQTCVDMGRLEYISIGDNCCLSVSSLIAHDYSWYVFARSHNDILPDSGGKIEIGNNVFIGYKSVVLKNTKIGDNVIIGAYSVVNKDIPSGTVWAGNPARQICTIDEYYEKKKKEDLSSAKYRAKIVYESKNRKPTIEEMGYFAYLFLPRTKENYDKYLKNIEFNGVKDDSIIRKIFFETCPKYNSFDEFLKDVFN